jgi:hypothetical protein
VLSRRRVIGGADQGRENKKRPPRVSPSGLGTGPWCSAAHVASHWLATCSIASDRGGLVKQKSLTCWQSEPQQLLKRRCPLPCSPSAEEGLSRRLPTGPRGKTRIRPCTVQRMDVRDEIDLCTRLTLGFCGSRPLKTGPSSAPLVAPTLTSSPGELPALTSFRCHTKQHRGRREEHAAS